MQQPVSAIQWPVDLDSQVEADPALLEEFMGRDKESSPNERPRPHFHSSYSSVVITRRPDGVGWRVSERLEAIY